MIAGNATSTGQAGSLPSPPPSNPSSLTPNNTPSTTPTNGNQSALERQLNSPFIPQQLPPAPSYSPPSNAVVANVPTVVTLTPPPEKDIKEIKLEPKQNTLLPQGKENIPLFEEKPIFMEKPIVAPRSPEVIDLETENENGVREKLIIPNFKKRKLEILREGGLEVTAVDLDARPSVIQPNVSSTPMLKSEEKPQPSFSLPVTKLVSGVTLTVTPDIGHMLPHQDNNSRSSSTQVN